MSLVGNSTLKNHSHFSGAKTTTCTWKSFHTFRVTKQTFIPTYMHQKILSCNKLDTIGENASKICCLPREDAFGCLIKKKVKNFIAYFLAWQRAALKSFWVRIMVFSVKMVCIHTSADENAVIRMGTV